MSRSDCSVDVLFLKVDSPRRISRSAADGPYAGRHGSGPLEQSNAIKVVNYVWYGSVKNEAMGLGSGIPPPPIRSTSGG